MISFPTKQRHFGGGFGCPARDKNINTALRRLQHLPRVSTTRIARFRNSGLEKLVEAG
jgi:hypothetical protein